MPANTARPTIAVVSGRPGSGKTTLARKLTNELSWPLLSRDDIYEGIYHTANGQPELVIKEQLSKETFDVLFDAVRLLASANVTLIVEAAFQDWRWRAGLEPLLPMIDPRIVHCTVDIEVAHRRIGERRQSGTAIRSRRSPVAHGGGNIVRRPFEPLSLPVPTMHVATVDGYDPQLDEILSFLTAH